MWGSWGRNEVSSVRETARIETIRACAARAVFPPNFGSVFPSARITDITRSPNWVSEGRSFVAQDRLNMHEGVLDANALMKRRNSASIAPSENLFPLRGRHSVFGKSSLQGSEIRDDALRPILAYSKSRYSRSRNSGFLFHSRDPPSGLLAFAQAVQQTGDCGSRPHTRPVGWVRGVKKCKPQIRCERRGKNILRIPMNLWKTGENPVTLLCLKESQNRKRPTRSRRSSQRRRRARRPVQ